MTRRDGAAYGALSIESYPDLISQIIISSIHRQREGVRERERLFTW